jgi:2-polyprenyl-6-methoxyphenol hydroxylase-like FAD-dependent oxidoreductase
MRIAIIGGGIGGLTAALALRQFGFEPQIFEQAPQLLGVGAAILVWPNAMRVLHRLGLADTIREQSGCLEKSSWLRWDGQKLNSFLFPRTDLPAVAVHRAQLQQILLGALPPESIHLDHVFAGYKQLPDRVIVRFENAASFESDILIGADGLHSRARHQLLNDGPPTDHDYAAWRGVVPHTFPSVQSATATEIYGRGQRFGIGPLGGGKVGWWASANKSLLKDRKPGPGGAEDHESSRAELLRLFGNWCKPIPDLIRATPSDALIRNAVTDRASVEQWGTGAITLLGDAIHPMTPNLGQGGCLAIEDAAVLARCLKKYAPNGEISEPRATASLALRRFETVRRTRTARLARFSRAYGVVGQWETSTAVRLRGYGLSLVPNLLTTRFLRAVFEYDAYSVRI